MKDIIKASSVKFSNGNVVVNTTPHPITFLDGDQVVICNSSKELLINARPVEVEVGPYLVQTKFVPTEEGQAIVDAIREVFPDTFIIGSIIATNAYKEVVGMTPVPGYERVAPAEKRMRTDKFNVGDCF